MEKQLSEQPASQSVEGQYYPVVSDCRCNGIESHPKGSEGCRFAVEGQQTQGAREWLEKRGIVNPILKSYGHETPKGTDAVTLFEEYAQSRLGASPVPSAALSKKAAELYETYRQDNWDHNHPEWKHLAEVERLEWYEKARMASAAPQSTLKEGLLKADKMAEEMGLELLAKGDKHGWSVLDDLGHRLREALEE